MLRNPKPETRNPKPETRNPFPHPTAPKGNAPKGNIQANRLFDRSRLLFNELRWGFGLMRHQVDHAVD
jgi:hypothetical protein